MSYTFCVSAEDAKKKWCPMTDTGDCVADRCMAWRWVETHIKDEHGDSTVLSGDTHGYCGLAGTPWQK